jgi:hypothetical protein
MSVRPKKDLESGKFTEVCHCMTFFIYDPLLKEMCTNGRTTSFCYYTVGIMWLLDLHQNVQFKATDIIIILLI